MSYTMELEIMDCRVELSILNTLVLKRKFTLVRPTTLSNKETSFLRMVSSTLGSLPTYGIKSILVKEKGSRGPRKHFEHVVLSSMNM